VPPEVRESTSQPGPAPADLSPEGGFGPAFRPAAQSLLAAGRSVRAGRPQGEGLWMLGACSPLRPASRPAAHSLRPACRMTPGGRAAGRRSAEGGPQAGEGVPAKLARPPHPLTQGRLVARAEKRGRRSSPSAPRRWCRARCRGEAAPRPYFMTSETVIGYTGAQIHRRWSGRETQAVR
jgi:hypothetical protein